MPLSVYLDTKTVHCQRRLNYIANLQIVMDLLTSLEVNPGLILIENTSKKFNQKHEMKAYIFTDFVNHFTTEWFSLCTLESSTGKTDRHDITELLLKVVLNTINQTTTVTYMEEEKLTL
jgi:hypothetical protein